MKKNANMNKRMTAPRTATRQVSADSTPSGNLRNVVIGNVNPGDVRCNFMCALLNTMDHDSRLNKRISGTIFTQGGPSIGRHRNFVVEKFLASNPADWLLFIDSDMVWPADALDRLARHADAQERPILAAVCAVHLPDGSVVPNAFVQRDDGNRVPMLEPSLPLPGSPPCMVADAVGAAFLLVHRRVFEQMAAVGDVPPWFGDMPWNGIVVGEDVGFCLRARAAGFPIHVVSGIDVAHEKTVMFKAPAW